MLESETKNKLMIEDEQERRVIISAKIVRLNTMRIDLFARWKEIQVNLQIIRRMESSTSASVVLIEEKKREIAIKSTSLWTSALAFDDLINILLLSDSELNKVDRDYLLELSSRSKEIINSLASLT